jgi:pimeloyl-ACP methyl ester carboxylesterase
MSTVLLLHAGIADSRMWEPQVAPLEAAGHRVLTPDLRGFGRRPAAIEPFSHARDVEVLLDGPTSVVGCSLGGRVALELALLHPALVERLVLIAPGLTGWEWSDAVRAGWAEEEEAYERGDLEGAAEASVRMWVDGPRRSPDEVDADLRLLARNMVLRSYVLEQETLGGSAEEAAALDPPVHERLGEITCPTLVLVGNEDADDLRAIAKHVAASIPGSELVELPGTAHLPSLERPDAVNPLLLQFLA